MKKELYLKFAKICSECLTKTLPVFFFILSFNLASNAQIENLQVEETSISGGAEFDLMLQEAIRKGEIEKFKGDNTLQKPLAPDAITTFDGPDFDVNGTYNSGSRFIPPDPSSAAGTDRVISVVNCLIECRTKSGTLLWIDDLAGFFSSLSPATKTFDPKVIYDQYAGRFVVVTLERVNASPPANPHPSNVSKIFVAVSKTSSPTTGTTADWYYLSIDAKTVIGGLEYWADYPGFAIDEDAVYITNNMFTFPPPSLYGGVRLWIVHKGLAGGFYGGGAATVTVHDPYASAGTATTTQPAHIFGAGGVPGGVGLIGTFLVSYSGLTDGTLEYVQVVRVDDPLGSPTFTQEYISVSDLESSFPELPDAPQSGTATLVEVNDRRALHAVWRSGLIWFTTTLRPGSGPDLGETTAHWFKLSTSAVPGGAITLSDQGDIGGEDIASTTYTFFPAIAVNSTGDVIIGFSASASTIYPGAYYAGRYSTDPAGTVNTAVVVKAGVDYYIRTFGGPRNRWGDYSGASIDPSDGSFWVFNEYAMSRGTIISGEDGRWATVYANIPLDELPVELSSFTAKVLRSGEVQLNWRTETEVSNYGFEVERLQDYNIEKLQAWEKIGFVEGNGNSNSPKDYSFTDNVIGGKYSYRLKQIDTDGQFEYSKVIEVDAGNIPDGFVLEQNYPNPFNPSTTIKFALSETQSAKLVIYDILGNEVAVPFDGTAEGGKIYDVEFKGENLSSGIYFYRLETDSKVENRKMLLLK